VTSSVLDWIMKSEHSATEKCNELQHVIIVTWVYHRKLLHC